ncbi:MAG TPA: hypothetical protein VGP73_08010 [Thermoanaerobaculia bacterium]
MSEPLDPPVPPPPPPYVPPPPPPGLPPPGPPTVRISEWLNQAWAVIQPYWLEYVLAILVAHLVILAAELMCILPILIVAGPMMGGVFVYLAKRMLGLPVQISDVFKGFRRFGDTFLLGLLLILPPLVFVPLIFLPTILAAVGFGNTQAGEAITQATGCLTVPLVVLFLVVYPVVVGTYLVFALPLVLFRRMGALDAIRQSIEIVKPQFTNFLLFMLADLVLLWAASFAGSALFCIGFLLLSPLAASLVGTMQLLAYRDFVGLTPEDLAPYAD